MARPRLRCVRRILAGAAMLGLAGCATKHAYLGTAATDLSTLHPGTPRAAVEAVTGAAEHEAREGAHLRVRYVVDRGYVGRLEPESTGVKILYAPVMAFGEFVSLGLAGWMARCASPCQKGLLLVEYDESGRLHRADEQWPADEHPAVGGCARSAVRADPALCRAVREQVRPSSLPRH